MRFSVKKSKKFVLKVVLLSFVAYVIFLFINQQIKIKQKNDELARINEQIVNEKSKNKEIRSKLSEYGDGENSNKKFFENAT